MVAVLVLAFAVAICLGFVLGVAYTLRDVIELSPEESRIVATRRAVEREPVRGGVVVNNSMPEPSRPGRLDR